MRTLTALIFAAAAANLTPLLANAQQTTPPVLTEQKPNEVLSDNYIGAEVVARSPEGLASVGKVTDLVVDSDAKVVGVLVDIGGFLGVGAKPVGLAWSALSAQQADGELLLLTDLTRQELEDAPEFKSLADLQVERDRKAIEAEKVPASSQQ